ncbi:MAG: hypothetical protein AAFS10_12795 [Myxococcota bacterium]
MRATLLTLIISTTLNTMIGCAGHPIETVPLGQSAEPTTLDENHLSDGAVGRMDMDRLDQLLRSEAVGPVNGDDGVWEFVHNGVRMACLANADHDRMRLIAPILPVEQLTIAQVAQMMEANFHTALDARYATSNGILYATYIHPLSPLTDQQVRSALHQVASLARTFGTSYTSGELEFGPQPTQPGSAPSRKPAKTL